MKKHYPTIITAIVIAALIATSLALCAFKLAGLANISWFWATFSVTFPLTVAVITVVAFGIYLTKSKSQQK